MLSPCTSSTHMLKSLNISMILGPLPSVCFSKPETVRQHTVLLVQCLRHWSLFAEKPTAKCGWLSCPVIVLQSISIVISFSQAFRFAAKDLGADNIDGRKVSQVNEWWWRALSVHSFYGPVSRMVGWIGPEFWSEICTSAFFGFVIRFYCWLLQRSVMALQACEMVSRRDYQGKWAWAAMVQSLMRTAMDIDADMYGSVAHI